MKNSEAAIILQHEHEYWEELDRLDETEYDETKDTYSERYDRVLAKWGAIADLMEELGMKNPHDEE